MKKAPLIALAALIALAGITGWLLLRGPSVDVLIQPFQKSNPPETIRLAYVATTHAVLPGIALQQNYYRREGLEVIPRKHSFGKPALEDMLQGTADFATVADPPIMREIMQGRSICVIATIQTSNKDNAVIVRKGSGISEPAALKGARIGLTRGTTADFFLDAFLVANGISWQEVVKIYLQPEQLQDALAAGRVDAVSAFQPFLAQLQRSMGERVLAYYDPGIYTWTFNIVATQEYVRQHPQTVKKLLKALLQAEAYVERNPAAAQKTVADYSGMDLELVRQIWSGMHIHLGLDQLLVLALEDESRWAINSGMIDSRPLPNYLDYIYFDALESLKPSAVRILGRQAQ